MESVWIEHATAKQRNNVANMLEGIELCNPTKPFDDLSRAIKNALKNPNWVTDILIQAKNGNYEAILLGSRQENAFHIEYLCSVSKGAGAVLIQKVKDRLHDGYDKITVFPFSDVKPYYDRLGFVNNTWPAPTGARRRKTRRRRQTYRKKHVYKQ
jgi:hypothetical protein